jgi:hypothetical protein
VRHAANHDPKFMINPANAMINPANAMINRGRNPRGYVGGCGNAALLRKEAGAAFDEQIRSGASPAGGYESP